MKKLTRVRLINWHRFTNDVIEFDRATLLSGENGAGKSTLLDAIQFVVTCSAGNFNKAAHENGNRKLTGYVRCKTGRENKPYERTGEVSAHVALEFYEEKKERYFVVGAVIDSASEGQEKTARYLIDKSKLDDVSFMDGKTPRSITGFRTANGRMIKQWCTTEKDARSMVKNRFGRIDDKFFRLIPKAMAFRPIDDIKDFVYSYVLDKKDVNIDLLRENVRTYQELQKTLQSVKLRISKLEEIEKKHALAEDGMKKDKMYEYYLAQVQADITGKEKKQFIVQMKKDEHRQAEKQTEFENTKKEQADREKISNDIRAELASDKDFIARDAQKRHLEELNAKKDRLTERKTELIKQIKMSKNQLKVIEKLLPDEGDRLKEYADIFDRLAAGTAVSDAVVSVEQLIEWKTSVAKSSIGEHERLKISMLDYEKELRDLKAQIEQLEKKNKITYPGEVNRLFEAVKAEFARLGRKPEPRILCELLEIEDESWSNAVEGYLNTQRLYILVEPECFDIALGTYDRLRREKKAYGVGLINTQKLDEYDTAPEGSLATVVSSKNKYAARYVNMILGKVTMCNHYSDLKKYRTSITRECMKYQNHVANAIKPEIYGKPYIGMRAVKIQLEQARTRLVEIESLIKEAKDREKCIEKTLTALDTNGDSYIRYNIHVLSELVETETEITKCQQNIATLEKNSNMLQKELQLDALARLIKELAEKMSALDREIGFLNHKIEAGKEAVERCAREQADRQAEADRLLANGESSAAWRAEYEKLISGKSYAEFQTNYDRRRKANQTTISKNINEMEHAMVEYKTAHDFGAAATMDGYYAFAAEYDKLYHSELLTYEEKVESARKAAEDEFREQFLAKLQENMKQAQGEFKELNRALADIQFSSERYEFQYMPSKKYRQYYEMIMDDFNAMQGESLFSGIFHETHREVIDELFDRLAFDSENEAKALTEFTDYRTYMDYDIKIHHTDGSYSFYSKVCEEKSGGETQTPFYVTVAASFVQLYRGSIGGEAIGLVMFDEAFNNMDDERIGGVLEFLRRLPLQIIIAAPPDKIQYISPCVDETLLVMTDEKVSYVEEFQNGAV